MLNRDRLDIDFEQLATIPFLKAFDKLFNSMLPIEHKNEYGYVIWGGVAINILLQHLKICRTFYSYHDIELFLLKNNKLVYSSELIKSLETELIQNGNFGLLIGGLRIIEKFNPKNLDTFQDNRIENQDGDLEINNIIYVSNNKEKYFDGPKNTIDRLRNKDFKLRMKDDHKLQNLDRVSRRIYRTISKLFRLSQITKLKTHKTLDENVDKLISSYEEIVTSAFQFIETDNVNLKWLQNKNINSLPQALKWLYIISVTEILKRIAGIQDLNLIPIPKFNEYFFPNQILSKNISQNRILCVIKSRYFISCGTNIEFTKTNLADIHCEYLNYQKGNQSKTTELYSLK